MDGAAAKPTTPRLSITADPANYQPHFTHGTERIWQETNCYLDLWIEVLHALGLDPVPAFACLLAADHDGFNWSFAKQQPEDLRRLYGLEVGEENAWLPMLELVESGPARGVLHTVEVDSWWLPDTAGTAYRNDHVKTTITPTKIDSRHRVLWYVHNAGLYELTGDDFDGVFGLRPDTELTLPPYIEVIRHRPDWTMPNAMETIVQEQFSRRASGNPVERLAAAVTDAVAWLPGAGMDKFHLWAFASLRQCGATAELLADFAEYIDSHFTGAGAAAVPLREAASNAKSAQFKMARVAIGRKGDVAPALSAMVTGWQEGFAAIADAVG
ncbi:hypothetical protein ABIA30_001921 [Mycobacterium sp. MAA66]|uniref:DUF1839 family protein n=1 Tax=Mycobacterium sp. MAA66 TaxID=3156297 RepID=UPI003516B7F7